MLGSIRLLLLALLLLTSAWLFAANTLLNITAESQGSSLTFEQIQPLSFGRFVPAATNSTITVTPQGAISTPGEILLNGHHQAGLLRIEQGVSNQWGAFEFSSSSIQLTPNTGVGLPMTVQLFKLADNGDGALVDDGFREVTLNDQGKADILVGARLSVNANQAPGVYTGQVAISLVFE